MSNHTTNKIKNRVEESIINGKIAFLGKGRIHY